MPSFCQNLLLNLSLISTILITISSCGPSPTTASAPAMIHGSEPEAWVKSHTIALVHKDNGKYSCSGTIIADDWVLTAAHCFRSVDGTLTYQAKDYQVFFGEVDSDAAAPRANIDRDPIFFSHHVLHPHLDLSLIHFQGGLPAGYEPAKILGDSSVLSKNTPIKIAGFGRVSPNCDRESDPDCEGRLRQRKSKIVSIPKGSMFANLIVLSSKGGGACYGDSGGPAYAQIGHEWYLIGTLHGFWQPLSPLPSGSDNFCTHESPTIYARTAPFLDWIEKNIGRGLGDRVIGTRESHAPTSLPAPGASFSSWCEADDLAAEYWATTNHIMMGLVNLRGFGVPENRRLAVYSDCSALEKMLDDMPTFSFPLNDFFQHFRARDLRPLGSLHHVETLEIADTNAGDFSFTRHLQNLKTLKIRANRVSPDLATLLDAPALETLELDRNTDLKASGLAILRRIPTLRKLNVIGAGATPALCSRLFAASRVQVECNER